MAVVREEGVVPRRGSLVLSPFGGGEYCGVDDPFGLDLHQQGPPKSDFSLSLHPHLMIEKVHLMSF
jgi:hypothetical protein